MQNANSLCLCFWYCNVNRHFTIEKYNHICLHRKIHYTKFRVHSCSIRLSLLKFLQKWDKQLCCHLGDTIDPRRIMYNNIIVRYFPNLQYKFESKSLENIRPPKNMNKRQKDQINLNYSRHGIEINYKTTIVMSLIYLNFTGRKLKIGMKIFIGRPIYTKF